MPSITNDVHYTAGYADPSPYPALSVQGPDLAASQTLQSIIHRTDIACIIFDNCNFHFFN